MLKNTVKYEKNEISTHRSKTSLHYKVSKVL